MNLYNEHYDSESFFSINKYDEYFDRNTGKMNSCNKNQGANSKKKYFDNKARMNFNGNIKMIPRDRVRDVIDFLDRMKEQQLMKAESLLIYPNAHSTEILVKNVSPSDALCLSEAKEIIHRRSHSVQLKRLIKDCERPGQKG